MGGDSSAQLPTAPCWAMAQRQWPEQPENGMFCITRLSLGCFYFQRELISSGCAGVQGFFLPVTKSWKTPLNNISEHGWNKGRAWWGEEQLNQR